MQKGVDPIGIGVIALGVVMLIVLVIISNNQMPQPLPAPQVPDLNGLARKIEDPLSAAVGAAGMGGAPMMGGPTGGFGSAAPPSAPMGGPAAPPSAPRGGGRGEMPEDY
ncbi:MAG: hypothetical protein KatS3mg018_0115 [Fimbriimonadales bacterium]|nr:MAG: hypothetical protein KatS3mg018_0115 [Fimbriimonadales bacterium]